MESTAKAYLAMPALVPAPQVARFTPLNTPATQLIQPSASPSQQTFSDAPADILDVLGNYEDEKWCVLASEHISRSWTYKERVITVGRSSACNIVLRDERVSKVQFRITLEVEADVSAATQSPSPAPLSSSATAQSRHLNTYPVTGHLNPPSSSKPTAAPSIKNTADVASQLQLEPPSSSPRSVSQQARLSTSRGRPLTRLARVVLEDLSSNGTFVNDRLVGKGCRCELHNGDYIDIVSLPSTKRSRTAEAAEEMRELRQHLYDAESTVPKPKQQNRPDDTVAYTALPSATATHYNTTKSDPPAVYAHAPAGGGYLEHYLIHLYLPQAPPRSILTAPMSAATVASIPSSILMDTTVAGGAVSPGASAFSSAISSSVAPASSDTQSPPLQKHEPTSMAAPLTLVSTPPGVPSSMMTASSSQQRSRLEKVIRTNFIALVPPKHRDAVSVASSDSSVLAMPKREIQWGHRVGAGASGEVYLGIDILSGVMVAIKVLNGTSSSSTVPQPSGGGPPVRQDTRAYSGNDTLLGRDDTPFSLTSVSNGDSFSKVSPERGQHDDADADETVSEDCQAAVKSRHCSDPRSSTDQQRPTVASTEPYVTGTHSCEVEQNEEADASATLGPDDTPTLSPQQQQQQSSFRGLTKTHISELSILTKLHHKHIVQCLGFQYVELKGICILMEYVAGGTLQSLIKSFGAFQENVIRIYTIQILEGLEYLASNNVVHGDLKSANVLVSEKGTVKLTDFGTSHILREYAGSDGMRCTRCKRLWRSADIKSGRQRSTSASPNASDGIPVSTFAGEANNLWCDCALSPGDLRNVASEEAEGVLCGTPLYMSPELIRTQVSTFASDVWALGCIVFEMATGGVLPWREVHQRDPFTIIYHIGCHVDEGPSFEDIYRERSALAAEMRENEQRHLQHQQQQRNSGDGNDASNASTPTSVSDVGSVMTSSDANVTPSPVFMNFIKSMFTMDPALRPHASDLLRHPFITGEQSADSVRRWLRSIGQATSSLFPASPREEGGADRSDGNSPNASVAVLHAPDSTKWELFHSSRESSHGGLPLFAPAPRRLSIAHGVPDSRRSHSTKGDDEEEVVTSTDSRPLPSPGSLELPPLALGETIAHGPTAFPPLPPPPFPKHDADGDAAAMQHFPSTVSNGSQPLIAPPPKTPQHHHQQYVNQHHYQSRQHRPHKHSPQSYQAAPSVLGDNAGSSLSQPQVSSNSPRFLPKQWLPDGSVPIPRPRSHWQQQSQQQQQQQMRVSLQSRSGRPPVGGRPFGGGRRAYSVHGGEIYRHRWFLSNEELAKQGRSGSDPVLQHDLSLPVLSQHFPTLQPPVQFYEYPQSQQQQWEGTALGMGHASTQPRYAYGTNDTTMAMSVSSANMPPPYPPIRKQRRFEHQHQHQQQQPQHPVIQQPQLLPQLGGSSPSGITQAFGELSTTSPCRYSQPLAFQKPTNGPGSRGRGALNKRAATAQVSNTSASAAVSLSVATAAPDDSNGKGVLADFAVDAPPQPPPPHTGPDGGTADAPNKPGGRKKVLSGVQSLREARKAARKVTGKNASNKAKWKSKKK